MADTPTTPDSDLVSNWSGLAPFVKMAFKLQADQEAKNTTMMQMAAQKSGAKLQVPGGHAPAPTTPGGMGSGPMTMPQQVAPNGLPPALQESVAGPMSMPSMPQTPLIQSSGLTPTGIPSQINHFVTGMPNPFGTRSIS